MNAPRLPRRQSLSRAALILVALVFVAFFLVLPLVAVFAEALGKGFAAYGAALVDPDAVSAIKLTLLTAATEAQLVGPILLGMSRPVHVLTPSVTARGIVNMTALAVNQAAAERAAAQVL